MPSRYCTTSAPPEGSILVLSYEDRPGMVGRIGTTLGQLGVNIASMHVGRRAKRERAIVVLILDEDADRAHSLAERISAELEAGAAQGTPERAWTS